MARANDLEAREPRSFSSADTAAPNWPSPPPPRPRVARHPAPGATLSPSRRGFGAPLCDYQRERSPRRHLPPISSSRRRRGSTLARLLQRPQRQRRASRREAGRRSRCRRSPPRPPSRPRPAPAPRPPACPSPRRRRRRSPGGRVTIPAPGEALTFTAPGCGGEAPLGVLDLLAHPGGPALVRLHAEPGPTAPPPPPAPAFPAPGRAPPHPLRPPPLLRRFARPSRFPLAPPVARR